MKESYFVDEKGYYGEFGGAYVPEILYATVRNLQETYMPIVESAEFKQGPRRFAQDFSCPALLR